MMFHFYSGSGGQHILEGEVPSILDTILAHGWLGVECFFVISGFVIAYSLEQARVNWSFFGRFVLRRSVRLDPPYWVTILLMVAVNGVSNFVLKKGMASLPTWPQVLAHLGYCQDLLGYANIVPVFWTLCLEFQFYLVFCLLLWPAQIVERRLKRYRGRQDSQASRLLVFGPLSLLALCWPVGLLPANDLRALFLPTWYMFLLGVLSFWSLQHPLFRAWFGIVILTLSASFLWTGRIEVLVAATTALAIWYAGNRNRLSQWLNYRWLQYLGSLSYCLYLLHAIIGGRVLHIGSRLTSNSVSGYLFSLPIALVFSLLGAHILYVYVERPCVRLAQLLKNPLPGSA
jgi:peptidoglycan/LPS O-acetylase OafA/YrhL